VLTGVAVLIAARGVMAQPGPAPAILAAGAVKHVVEELQAGLLSKWLL
jgi:hypothetical protein